MKRNKKIFMIILIILTLFALIPQVSFASPLTPEAQKKAEDANKLLENLQRNIPESKEEALRDAINPLAHIQHNQNDISSWSFGFQADELPDSVIGWVGLIIRVLRNISIMVTIVVIVVLGVKYIIGSVEQKAEYKKDYINIIIGVALITLITSIVDAILTAAGN